MHPSVTVPGPREGLIVARDSSRPLPQRHRREKDPGTLSMGTHKLLCNPAVLFAKPPCTGKRQQRFSSPRKVRARTKRQLGVSSLQKMAEHKFLSHSPSGKKKNKLNSGDKLLSDGKY